MIHLRTIQSNIKRYDQFPFNVSVIRSLKTLSLEADVTFFVGENGSGKSTLLEAIASGVNLPVVGSESIERDATMAQVRQLGDQLKYVWNKRTRRGFFMRSEDFFCFVRRMAQVEADMHADLQEIDNDPTISDKSLARLPYMQELGALKRAYGDGLDAQSHGESYFKLFRSRFVPDGLYLLDEPEAPLSPMRQLSLLAMLREMVKQKAQFIIATHSPILLAYPGAVIYSFDEDEIRQVAYDQLEHVIVTRDFLNNPESYLRHLMEL